MKRRAFIQSVLAGAGSSILTSPMFGDELTENQLSWAKQFRIAKQSQPWLGAFDSVGQETFASNATVTGRWPEDLQGSLYRNGPAQHEIGDFRYQHWFDGDGMLQLFQFDANGVHHAARMIQTTKYLAEKAAGRALYPGFASVPPNPAAVTSPDLINPGNISVLHHHGKLLALWEAGSPWEMNRNTLATKGLYSFGGDMQGVPFSAHPRVEADGTLWNFGYVSGARLLVLWHINAAGKMVKAGKIAVDPISMPHDFIVTARHIVIMIPPLHYEPDEPTTFLDTHVWHPERPTRLLVVDKNDFANIHWVELPSQWVFHFGNGWEDSDGVIRFDGARSEDPMAMINTFRQVMRGKVANVSTTHHFEYRIDTKSWSVNEAPMFDGSVQSEFPVIDPRVSCQPYQRLVMLAGNRDDPVPYPFLNRVMTFDFKTGKRVTFRYPDSQIPEEHLFIGKPGSAPESEGWVLGTAFDWQTGRTLLNVFDVADVNAGPLATATLPYALPLGLHGKYVA